MSDFTFPTIEQFIGATPLVRLQRIHAGNNNTILLKLEGNNPAGSVKDRPALSMIVNAEQRGLIKPGDTLIEATSGNTGIALAMVAAMKGYKLVLFMPERSSEERKLAMAAYGATLIQTTGEHAMEAARDQARQMADEGKGYLIDQFSNEDNPLAHYQSTGPEIWQQTQGRVTHFVSSMGTTGTIMGTSRYLKEQNSAIQIIGMQPSDGSNIAGIRRWPQEYLPSIYHADQIDSILDVSQHDAEVMTRRLAKEEGIFCGVSSGGAVHGAVQLASELENAVIVSIICDRGDRYLSTGIFS